MFGDAWPPDWEKLAYHDFQFEETFKMAKLPMPSNWNEFVANSQQYQADLLKYAIEHYRREKYSKIGSFFQFQFVDCWPSITWSVVSYARRPKAGYWAMQRAFQPVLIEAELVRRVWSKGKEAQPLAEVGLDIAADLWVVNDEHQALEGTSYEVVLHRKQADVLLAKENIKEVIPADGVAQLPKLYCTLPGDLAPGGYELVLTLKQGDKTLSENTYPVSIVD
jgi:beta-mannosidase